MMNDNNTIKYAVEKLTLSEAAKRRIIAGCEEASECETRRAPRIRWTLVTAALLLVALTVGTLAATGVFRKAPGRNKSHFGTQSEIAFEPIISEIPANSNAVLSDDGEYVIRLNALTGGEDKVYIDCFLTRKDGGAITDKSSDGGELPLVNGGTGTLTLSDGTDSEVFFKTISDSTETEYHLEGMALLVKPRTEDSDYEEYLKTRCYSDEEIKELLDGATVSVGGLFCVTDNTERIDFAKHDLGEIIGDAEPGEAVPDKEPFYYYEDILVPNNIISELGAGGMEIPLSSDGAVVIDNFAFAPYGYSRTDDETQVMALYINLKGFDEDVGSFIIESQDDDTRLLTGAVTSHPAPGIITVAIHDEYQNNVTPEDLWKILGLTGRRVETDAVCSFSSAIEINGDFKNDVIERDIDPVTMRFENGSLTITKVYISNTDLKLYGTSSVLGGTYGTDGEDKSFDEIIKAAYVVTDNGETVMLGQKLVGGYDPETDLEVIGWQCETVLDPEKIAEIYIGDAVIKLK